MLCKEIISRIEAAYPKNYAMEWDNVGLLAGRTDKEVSTVYIALDLTEEVIAEAVSAGADMIVTHHPLIFSPLRKITNEHFIGSRVVTLLQHDISYYAMHTNYDVLRMAELSAEKLGLLEDEALEVTVCEEDKGIGRIGSYSKKLTLEECCDLVKEKFELDSVKVFGEVDQTIERIAIVPGSGKSVIKTAIAKGADVIITGDIDHHEGIDAVAQGMAIIDAGHYGLEHIFVEDMRQFLETALCGVEVKTATEKHPFQIC